MFPKWLQKLHQKASVRNPLFWLIQSEVLRALVYITQPNLRGLEELTKDVRRELILVANLRNQPLAKITTTPNEVISNVEFASPVLAGTQQN